MPTSLRFGSSKTLGLSSTSSFSSLSPCDSASVYALASPESSVSIAEPRLLNCSLISLIFSVGVSNKGWSGSSSFFASKYFLPPYFLA